VGWRVKMVLTKEQIQKIANAAARIGTDAEAAVGGFNQAQCSGRIAGPIAAAIVAAALRQANTGLGQVLDVLLKK
jgi:hypothetical protein